MQGETIHVLRFFVFKGRFAAMLIGRWEVLYGYSIFGHSRQLIPKGQLWQKIKVPGNIWITQKKKAGLSGKENK